MALPDGPEYVAALFGTLKLGAVVVMVNPQLAGGRDRRLLDYTRPRRGGRGGRRQPRPAARDATRRSS